MKKVILAIVIIIMLFSLVGRACDSGTSGSTAGTVRCSYCGKTIISGGVKIHCTPIYNGGVVVCDYCGAKTSID